MSTDAEPEPVMTGEGEVAGYRCPECDKHCFNERKALAHCADESVSEPEPDREASEQDDTPLPVGEHYDRAERALAALAAIPGHDAETLGNQDFVGWYHSRAETRTETITEGFDRRGRVMGLGDDYATLTGGLDRVLYATINYQSGDARHWQPFAYGADGKDWMDDNKPMPGYDAIEAIAPFADIDVADEHKERPLPEEKQAIVEDAAAAYYDEFASLARGSNAVFALDSVGGVYLFVAPASTLPIAQHFATEDRETVFKEFVSRMDDWLDGARERVNEAIPEAEGLFEPDLLNNVNRLYKAPLSIHSSIRGVVHPLDVTANGSGKGAEVNYDFAAFADVDEELIGEAVTWAEAFTDPEHAECVEGLVATLWPEYVDRDGVDSWQDALEAWLDDQRTQERERAMNQTAIKERRESRTRDLSDIERTPHIEDLYDAEARIDVRDVAREVAAEWDTDPGRDPPRFAAPWHTNHKSGTSCFVDRDGFTDLKEGGNGGGAAKLIARAHGIINNCGDSLSGRYLEAIDELRELGYDIPWYDPERAEGEQEKDDDSEKSPYYDLSINPIIESDAFAEQQGSGHEFAIREASDVWYCQTHEAGGGALGLVAVLENVKSCEDATKLSPRQLLEVCIAARDKYDTEIADATPPYKALVGAAKEADLSMSDESAGILGKNAWRIAGIVYEDLTLSDLAD